MPHTTYKPTEEQAHIVSCFRAGSNLKIEAGAGTGKTTSLELLGRSTNRQGQYIAFNRAIVEDPRGHRVLFVPCKGEPRWEPN